MSEVDDEDWSPAWSTRFTGVVDWGPPVRLNEDEMCILRENAPDATPRDIEEFEAIITSGIADRKRFDEAMLTAQARSEAQQVMSDCLKLRERLAAIAASTSRVHWDLGPTAIDELMRSLTAVMDQGALALVHYARDTGGAPGCPGCAVREGPIAECGYSRSSCIAWNPRSSTGHSAGGRGLIRGCIRMIRSIWRRRRRLTNTDLRKICCSRC